MGLETAAIIGLGSLALSAGTATASFVQAGKQKKKIEAAERDAQKAMQEAKGRLDQNFYEGLGIQKEKFEEERENILSGLSTIVQASQEGEERGAAVSAGRAALFNQQAQAKSRIAQGQELQRLQELAAKEDARNRDALVNIGIAEVGGQQRIAKDARAARTAAVQQGVKGLVSAGQQALKLGPLFGDDTVSAQDILVEDPFAEFQKVFGNVEETSLDRALRSDAIFNPNFDPNKVLVEEFDIDQF